MTTPEERLCSRKWRLRNSVWLLWPILSAGIFTSVGLLWTGIKSKQRTFLVFAALYGVWTISWIVLSNVVDLGTKQHPTHTVVANVVNSVMAILWITGIAHCFFLNRSWLRWRAAHPKGQTAWYASGAGAPAGQSGSPPVAEEPAEALTRLYNGAAADVPSGASTTVLDLNTASSPELAALGVDTLWADRIVAARERLGGFQAPDQVMTDAGVPPHVYAALRGRVEVNPSAAPPQQARPAGGRRLDF